MRMKRLWMGLAALCVALSAPPAIAAEKTGTKVTPPRATLATFEGRTIDLAGDWGAAKACSVRGGAIECFRSEAEADSLSAASGGGATTNYSYSCSSPLHLYDGTYYGGRRLSFWERGYWQDMRWYGFNDQASSYIVGACYVYLAEHQEGGGQWYPGPTYPYAGSPTMYYGWSNQITSIYVG